MKKPSEQQEQPATGASVNSNSWGNFGGFDQQPKVSNTFESKAVVGFESKAVVGFESKPGVGFDSFQNAPNSGFTGGFGSDTTAFSSNNNSTFQADKAFSSGFSSFSNPNPQSSFANPIEKKGSFSANEGTMVQAGQKDSDNLNTSSESLAKKKRIFEEAPAGEAAVDSEKKLKEVSLVVENCFILMEKV